MHAGSLKPYLNCQGSWTGLDGRNPASGSQASLLRLADWIAVAVSQLCCLSLAHLSLTALLQWLSDTLCLCSMSFAVELGQCCFPNLQLHFLCASAALLIICKLGDLLAWFGVGPDGPAWLSRALVSQDTLRTMLRVPLVTPTFSSNLLGAWIFIWW